MSASSFKSFLKKSFPLWFVLKRKRQNDIRRADSVIFNEPPYLTNSFGEKMQVFYLSDELLGSEFYSYTQFRFPRNILWDRTNCFLNVHFYAHDNIFFVDGRPKVKIALLVETEQIDPKPYKALINNERLANSFDLIFTHSSKILSKYAHAKFIPAGGVWYGTDAYGGSLDELAYQKKTRGISIVSSDKAMCVLHKARINLAWRLKNNPLVDTYGTFDGGRYVKISETLTDYRFSIVIENTLDDYCFTEKVLNCFASMTIPIYLGAKKISNFFNPEGIIQLSLDDLTNIDYILQKCDEKLYSSKKEAVIENFFRVKEMTCQEDFIYENYSELLLELLKKKSNE